MQLKQKLSMLQNNMQLDQIDITNLEQHNIRFDVFYDLHTYMNYVSEREIKRTYRTNDLPKSDIKRLLGLMSITDKELEEDHEETDHWPGFIDDLAYRLDFIKYDRKGEYAGYSSSEPSFPDNYIHINKSAYEQFISLSLQQQVVKVLDVLVGDYGSSNHELMSPSVMGYLDQFDTYGSATGLLPFLKFDQSREFLLSFLSKLQPNVWYRGCAYIPHKCYRQIMTNSQSTL